MQQLEQDALLEQMKVEGALFSTASSWWTPVALLERERERESERERERERRSSGPDRGRGAQCGLHERCHSRLALRFRDRQRISFPPHLTLIASRCA